MTKFVTVVYAVKDEAEFEEKRKEIAAQHQAYDPENPPAWGVSAVSNADELRRVEMIEEVVEDVVCEVGGNDALNRTKEILAMQDLPFHRVHDVE
ncbi:TPA: hypothetical protein ACGSTL_001424 [Vibrio parahaemolyticus]|uniref:hypothetical protein n=1 Tax=Vibrio campbellii TaxID=680 RepID=UPI001F071ADD|nr:hypothetical protein [Vibrio campbellii]UMM06869.1 hypothetical protein MKR81_26780 [Vibrio campbellii]